METLEQCSALRAAVLDRDPRSSALLCAPARELGWKATPLAELPRPEMLAEMHLDALLVDAATIEDNFAWLGSRDAPKVPQVTVIACARESTVEQRVRGLRAGLDGWIDKDCHPHEVLARMQAIVRARRGRRGAARPAVRSGALHIDATRYDAVAGGRSAGLTTREFEVFALLLEHRGDVLAREQIAAGVWGANAPIGDRSVDIFVSRIRLKLKRISPGWSYLHTHVGAGYRFEPERDIAVALGSPAVEDLAATASDAIDAELNELMERASRASRRGKRVREQNLALA